MKILIPFTLESVIVNLVMFMMFLIYETNVLYQISPDLLCPHSFVFPCMAVESSPLQVLALA